MVKIYIEILRKNKLIEDKFLDTDYLGIGSKLKRIRSLIGRFDYCIDVEVINENSLKFVMKFIYTIDGVVYAKDDDREDLGITVWEKEF